MHDSVKAVLEACRNGGRMKHETEPEDKDMKKSDVAKMLDKQDEEPEDGMDESKTVRIATSDQPIVIDRYDSDSGGFEVTIKTSPGKSIDIRSEDLPKFIKELQRMSK